MSLEKFRDLCNSYRFYWFDSPEMFDKRIDVDGRNLKSVNFERGLVYEPSNMPTKWSAYGKKI